MDNRWLMNYYFYVMDDLIAKLYIGDIVAVKDLLDKLICTHYNYYFRWLLMTDINICRFIVEYHERKNIKVNIHTYKDTNILSMIKSRMTDHIEYIIYLSNHNYCKIKYNYSLKQIPNKLIKIYKNNCNKIKDKIKNFFNRILNKIYKKEKNIYLIINNTLIIYSLGYSIKLYNYVIYCYI